MTRRTQRRAGRGQADSEGGRLRHTHKHLWEGADHSWGERKREWVHADASGSSREAGGTWRLAWAGDEAF